ncbi:hypothetical protein J45TS6_35730 [Paenibacillus sp. J45TS6]|uniref:hypothetical protein n=1 Tax=Paenibacillus sp. J45TS6 TaxID=2807196 RepID=UPI001B1D80AB|nr:hypothetical protein [Paenibacillus sp. J45TS6]GIP45114.1 hypothetical protein J45TS6_35730 [Paenibacillus sp. J45TS6]
MKRKLLIFITLILTLLVGCNSKVEREEYIANVSFLTQKITVSSATSEKIINSYSRLWLKTIENGITVEDFADILETTTSEVNSAYSEFHNGIGLLENNTYSKVTNFNEAIIVAGKYYENTGEIKTLNTLRKDIQSLIKELASPPTEYESLYDELFQLYKNYESYVDLAINPTGNLQSYTSNSQSLATEIISGVRAVNAKMPQ